MKLSDLIKQENIALTYRSSDRNPHMDDDENMDHWRVTLRYGRSKMSLYFSKGFGHNGEPPTVEEVLDCLASDSAEAENANGSFDDWCSEYGYSPDSRQAGKIFKAVTSQAHRLKTLLGDSLYNTLLWDTERL